MKRAIIFLAFALLFAGQVATSAQNNNDNDIVYTTTDGKPFEFYFGTDEIVYHSYSDGVGRVCLKDPKRIPDSFFSLFIILDEKGEAFDNRPNNLQTVIIPDGVNIIGATAFDWCNCLTSVHLPSSVTLIGDAAFAGCESLTSINIPSSVTTIGELAFFECASLTSVQIPSSVMTIGEGAFSRCSNLKAFYGKFASSDNSCLIVDGVLNSVVISGLIQYSIPVGVTSIGGFAFSSCSSLTSVEIPSSVTSIRGAAFEGCTSSIYCKAVTPPSLIPRGDFTEFFEIYASGRKIYVPRKSVEAYKTAEGWKDYADDIVGYDFD